MSLQDQPGPKCVVVFARHLVPCEARQLPETLGGSEEEARPVQSKARGCLVHRQVYKRGGFAPCNTHGLGAMSLDLGR